MKITIGTLTFDVDAFSWNGKGIRLDCMLTEDDLIYLVSIGVKEVLFLNRKFPRSRVNEITVCGQDVDYLTTITLQVETDAT